MDGARWSSGRGWNLPRPSRAYTRDRYLYLWTKKMEELPTLGQFKELLQTDPIFCDYFNAFLNLPVSQWLWLSSYSLYIHLSKISLLRHEQVFAKRLTFINEDKRFEIEPAINHTYHVSGHWNFNIFTVLCWSDTDTTDYIQVIDDTKLLSWVHTNRLPIFWCSDFFYECRLCQSLVQKISDAGNKEFLWPRQPHRLQWFLHVNDN